MKFPSKLHHTLLAFLPIAIFVLLPTFLDVVYFGWVIVFWLVLWLLLPALRKTFGAVDSLRTRAVNSIMRFYHLSYFMLGIGIFMSHYNNSIYYSLLLVPMVIIALTIVFLSYQLIDDVKAIYLGKETTALYEDSL